MPEPITLRQRTPSEVAAYLAGFRAATEMIERKSEELYGFTDVIESAYSALRIAEAVNAAARAKGGASRLAEIEANTWIKT